MSKFAEYFEFPRAGSNSRCNLVAFNYNEYYFNPGYAALSIGGLQILLQISCN